MNLKLFSDIHLEHREFMPRFDPGSGEVLILAGDILTAKHLKTGGIFKKQYLTFLDDCSKNYNHIIWVDGNHHYYGYNYESTSKVIKEYLPSNFHYLQNSSVLIDGVWFLGCTLWSNFRNENAISMMENQVMMNDYRTIRITEKYRKLNTNDTLDFHKKSVKFLDTKLSELHGQKVVVVSHHSPTLRSIPERFKTYDYGGYYSDLEWLIEKHNPILMCHGHTHSFFDYQINNTRILCNPLGYPGETTGFNPDLQVVL